MRGSPIYTIASSIGHRSIPARAGEPVLWPSPDGLIRVDPRACGGAPALSVIVASNGGRSPRVRGSPLLSRLTVWLSWSIPARAGEPTPTQSHWRPLGVDPRACGGADRWNDPFSCFMGRSPRVRGSQVVGQCPEADAGSIPARAGEPASQAAVTSALKVDPRACGGAHVGRTEIPRS